MGDVELKLGGLGKALEYYGMALSGKKRLLGRSHPETLKELDNLGRTHYALSEESTKGRRTGM